MSGLLKDPGRLGAGLEEMIEQEPGGIRGDPEREINAGLEKLAEVEQERRGYLRLAAKGRMTDAELDRALGEPHPELTKRVRSYGAHRLVNMWVPTVNLLQEDT